MCAVSRIDTLEFDSAVCCDDLRLQHCEHAVYLAKDGAEIASQCFDASELGGSLMKGPQFLYRCLIGRILFEELEKGLK